ncbi:DUF4192 domain-containing protein [Streptomyces sp. NPDC051561]|uniref:DUF4192 domain-containing protein n=1 Tax=Streptomyces sp. NPDC051561 TaxID=3365658 RepID=UPI0037AAAA6C
MNTNSEQHGPGDLTEATEEQQITLRGPAQLADALPYLMGYFPSDSVVMVALHGRRGRFGGRLRLGIPKSPQEWAPVAGQLADSLVTNSERRGDRPDGIVVFLCQDPQDGESGRQVMERLRTFAQRLRTACGALDVPVLEALCISGGRFWSYCCPDGRCCPSEGTGLALPGTSVMAAAAAYAGIQVRGTLREMEDRLTPRPGDPSLLRERVRAMDTVGGRVVPRILSASGRAEVAQETLDLAHVLIKRLSLAPAPRGSWAAADIADDELVSDEEAATVVIGLQDRETRDRAAEWMEGPEAAPALRLWRLLARRCAGPYDTYAAPPLTLAGWVAWSTGDEPEARAALGLALRTDREYTFAQLLHQACNEGLDPERLRTCLRRDRAARTGRPGAGVGRPDRNTARRRRVAASSRGGRGGRARTVREVRAAGRGGSGRPARGVRRGRPTGGPAAGAAGGRAAGVRPAGVRPAGVRGAQAATREGVRRRETPLRARRGARSGR